MRAKQQHDQATRETFGSCLRQFRSARDMSLTGLASRIEMSTTTLSDIEIGKRPVPSIKRVAQMTKALGLGYGESIVLLCSGYPDLALILGGK